MKVVNQQYTHLKPDEKEIAKRFVAKDIFPGEYIYDVHLDVETPKNTGSLDDERDHCISNITC